MNIVPFGNMNNLQCVMNVFGNNKYGVAVSISDLDSDDYTNSEPPKKKNKGRMTSNA